MKLSRIVAIAKKAGINGATEMKKDELIRAIQIREGNMPCFSPGVKECAHANCCWREECVTSG